MLLSLWALKDCEGGLQLQRSGYSNPSPKPAASSWAQPKAFGRHSGCAMVDVFTSLLPAPGHRVGQAHEEVSCHLGCEERRCSPCLRSDEGKGKCSPGGEDTAASSRASRPQRIHPPCQGPGAAFSGSQAMIHPLGMNIAHSLCNQNMTQTHSYSMSPPQSPSVRPQPEQ